MIDLSCKIAGIEMKNPVIMASGTFGFGREYAQQYDIGCLGGISVKGLTLNPKEGNVGLRIYETPSGILNSVGLENPGVDAFLRNELDWLKERNTVILANLGGGTIEDYVQGAILLTEDCRKRKAIGAKGTDMIELNISCPNVKEGGLAFGIDTFAAREVIREVRRVTDLPLVVKLSPNARNLVEMAEMCEAEGADGVSLVNTFSAMKIDIRRRKSVFENLYAGLSGPAIKPIALRMVHQVAHAVSIPVIGMGGICSGEDAVEFIMAGAAAVQVGTYNFMNLKAGEQLIGEISAFMEAEGVGSLEEIRGIV